MSKIKDLFDGDRLNLERIEFVLVDDNQTVLDIMGHILTGFGVRTSHKFQTVKEAKALLNRTTVDFVLVDGHMPDEDGFELLRWLRRESTNSNRYVPAVLVTGDTNDSTVRRARDVGANFLVAKPLSPSVLLQRIFWIARSDRLFIECDSYSGPDRRFKRSGPPVGTNGRRADDLSGQLGNATEPNLSQDEINALMKPAKVVL